MVHLPVMKISIHEVNACTAIRAAGRTIDYLSLALHHALIDWLQQRNLKFNSGGLL